VHVLAEIAISVASTAVTAGIALIYRELRRLYRWLRDETDAIDLAGARMVTTAASLERSVAGLQRAAASMSGQSRRER
jgi:hypothetical protein